MSSVICLNKIFNIKVRIISSTSKYTLKKYYLGDPYTIKVKMILQFFYMKVELETAFTSQK